MCNKNIGITSSTKFYGVNGTNIKYKNQTEKFNYCVERVAKSVSAGDYSSAYYKVTVFYGLSLGFVDLNSKFFITGETKNIYYPTDQDCWT